MEKQGNEYSGIVKIRIVLTKEQNTFRALQYNRPNERALKQALEISEKCFLVSYTIEEDFKYIKNNQFCHLFEYVY